MATTTPNFGWAVPTSSDLVKNGATAIETLGDAIDASMVDLKGGTTGQVLAKATNTDMDFTWTTPSSGGSNTFYAGKNKIINGDFGIWQRGTSFTSNYSFNADRWLWYTDGTGAVVTCSQQTFTPASAPVSGYEGTYFLQIAQTTAGSGATANILFTNIEDVRLFANQTVTISFWAKAASGTPIIKPNIRQFFGSGGSSLVDTAGSNITISTSWTRYTQTFSVPSISGKTIGTGSYLQLGLGLPFNTVQTISFWGVQVEAGSSATDFVTASGNSKQGELAMCQRYYWRNTAPTATAIGYAIGRTSTQADIVLSFPVTMRTNPTAVETGGTFDLTSPNVGAWNITSFTFVHCSYQTGFIKGNTASGLSQGVIYELGIPTNGYVGFSAEL